MVVFVVIFIARVIIASLAIGIAIVACIIIFRSIIAIIIIVVSIDRLVISIVADCIIAVTHHFICFGHFNHFVCAFVSQESQ